MAKKLFEGTHKPVLDNEDRFVTAIEGQEAANYTTKEELFEQIDQEIIRLASGASNEVQFRNTTTGALDSDPLFKYDKATGVLNASTSLYIDRIKHIIGLGQSLNSNIGDDSTVLGIASQAGTTSTVAGYQSSGLGNANIVVGANASSGGKNGVVVLGYGTIAKADQTINIGYGISKTNANGGLQVGISDTLIVEGNILDKWIKFDAAQLIRSFEINSVAPVVVGTVTSGTANTLTDSSKTYITNQYAKFVVEKTTVGGEKEQRVILSNIVAGQLTVRDNWTVAPVAGDTFKIITATIIAAGNLGSIYRFNLSSGYDHALILPAVNDTFNRAFCEFYIEGHSGSAVLHKFPATGQLIQNQPKTEMVADRELVRLLSHASGTFHWDVENSVGLDAFGEATWLPQVITATQTTPRPLDGNLTINLIRRFSPVNVGGSLWAKYTSSIKRKFRFQVVCDITLNGTPSSVITIAIRYYNAAAGTTTDIIVPGSSIPIAGNGTRNVFVLSKLIELNPNDRFQIVHYNNNNTSYTLTPQLTVD